MRYFLSDGLKVYGPFEHKVVEKLLTDGRISLMTYVKTEKAHDWEAICAHADFTQPKAPEPASGEKNSVFGLMPDYHVTHNPDWIGDIASYNQSARSEQKEKGKAKKPDLFDGTLGGLNKAVKKKAMPQGEVWYLKSGNLQLGPYTYLKMLDLIKHNEMREHDLIRKASESIWKFAREVLEFSPNYIQKVEEPIVKELLERKFFRRTHARHDFRAEITVFDGKNTQHLECGDLSAGGCAFFSRPALYKNEDLVLIRYEDPVLSKIEGFHAKAKILRSEKVMLGTDDPIWVHRYSTQFLQVTQELQNWIDKLISDDVA